jgi:hypothetical protein
LGHGKTIFNDPAASCRSACTPPWLGIIFSRHDYKLQIVAPETIESNPMRKLAFLATFVAALALVGPASARLITFDQIENAGGGSPIPTGWAGFDWSVNFQVLNTADAPPGSGYENGAVSPPNVAYNQYGRDVNFKRSTPFEIVSFYLTAAYNNGLKVNVTGFRNDVQVDSATFTVDTTGPTLETLDWDVNRVVFSTGDGRGGDKNKFALDNLTTMPIPQLSADFASFSAVPEPSTWASTLLGFAGLGYAGFRKAKKGPAALDLA